MNLGFQDKPHFILDRAIKSSMIWDSWQLRMCFNKIVEKPTQAQTVDTRPFFLPAHPTARVKKGAGSSLSMCPMAFSTGM